MDPGPVVREFLGLDHVHDRLFDPGLFPVHVLVCLIHIHEEASVIISNLQRYLNLSMELSQIVVLLSPQPKSRA